MLATSGTYEIKFALADFQGEKNDLTRKFQGHEAGGKEFAKRFKEIQRSSDTTPSTSGVSLVTVGEPGEGSMASDSSTPPIRHKTPEKRKRKERKGKATSQTVEGAELPSPAKMSKPNLLDEDIEAQYLGKFCFSLIAI